MSRKKPIEVGQRYGKWTVTDINSPWGEEGEYVACQCECGVERSVRATNLRTGKSRSCGCYLKERTGEKHPRFKGAGDVSGTRYAQILREGTPGISGQMTVTTGAVGFDNGIITLNDANVTLAQGATISGVRDIVGNGSISCANLSNNITTTGTYATPGDLNNQLTYQNYSCSLSGKIIGAESATISCLNPSNGLVSGNVLWVDKAVKRMQGDMPLSEFIDLCGKIHEMGKKLLEETPISKNSDNPIINQAQKIARKYNDK